MPVPPISENFLCKINHTIMFEPVVAEDGFTYEKQAIEQWFAINNTSPTTREIIGNKLILNRDVKAAVIEFLDRHTYLIYEAIENSTPEQDNLEFINALIKRDAAILNRQNKEGRTPLHVAVIHNKLNMVQILLQAGANYKIRDKQLHLTPKKTAKILGFWDLVEIIEQKINAVEHMKLAVLKQEILKLNEETARLKIKDETYSDFLELQQTKFWFIHSSNLRYPLISSEEIKTIAGDGFIRAPVIGDGDCGFTAFGITRDRAIGLLLEHVVTNEPVHNLLKQPLSDVITQLNFINYVKNQGACLSYVDIANEYIAAQQNNEPAQVTRLSQQLELYSGDGALLVSYIHYDLRDKNIDAGWPHPAVLQALAVIQHLKLNIFTLNADSLLIPHEYYPTIDLTGEDNPQEVNLLFINGNHFDRLERSEFRNEGMYKSSNNTSSSVAYFTASSSTGQSLMELTKFLKHVGFGEQDEAEAMLKTNRDLVLAYGSLTDCAGRVFNQITGFQYAVWALDFHMWRMIKQHMEKNNQQQQLHEQLEEINDIAHLVPQQGWIIRPGGNTAWSSISWSSLIEALETYIENYNEWNVERCRKYWCQQVGGAQLILPAHVINEYNHPSRPFYPCSKWSVDEVSLPRFGVADWRMQSGHKLGREFAWLRASLAIHACGQSCCGLADQESGRADARFQGAHLFFKHVLCAGVSGECVCGPTYDLAAVSELLKSRTEQARVLLDSVGLVATSGNMPTLNIQIPKPRP